jgi:hypothetical protein
MIGYSLLSLFYCRERALLAAVTAVFTHRFAAAVTEKNF